MKRDPIELTDDETKWMPQSVDMVHPAEEVGKGAIVLLTTFVMCCRAFLAAPEGSSCHEGEWDLFVLPVIGAYLLVFFGCLAHDLVRLRNRARGSVRRRLAIARLVVGAVATGLWIYSLAIPDKTSAGEVGDCGPPPLPESSASTEGVNPQLSIAPLAPLRE